MVPEGRDEERSFLLGLEKVNHMAENTIFIIFGAFRQVFEALLLPFLLERLLG